MQFSVLPPVSPVALFRYAVVSEVRTRLARGQSRAEAVRATAGQLHVGPDGKPRLVRARVEAACAVAREPRTTELAQAIIQRARLLPGIVERYVQDLKALR